MRLEQITPVILTWNEEPNLHRCLDRLHWAGEIVVLDSGSTDATAAVAATFPNTRWLVRPFDDHTRQWNHAVDSVSTPWVLALDSDYVTGPGFEDELAALPAEPAYDAYYASFRYLVYGRPLRASLYPPRAVLFRRETCRYEPDGHTQILRVPGSSTQLKTRIDHDDRKSLERWFRSQDNYARLEAAKLLSAPRSSLRLQDRLRLTGWAAVPAVLLHTLLAKGALLEGWRGWFYVLQRVLAEIMLALRLLEARLRPPHS